MKGQVSKVLNNICLYSIITGGDISLVQFMKANLVEHFDNKRGEVNFVCCEIQLCYSMPGYFSHCEILGTFKVNLASKSAHLN